MKTRAAAAATLALLSSTLAGAAQPTSPSPTPSPTPAPRAVEARANQEMKRMSDFLAKLRHFALEAEETFDEIPDHEPKRELTNIRKVAVERPNHLVSDSEGDTLNRAAWYDGKTLTILDKEHNAYASAEMPDTIDATLDKYEDDYGVVLPLADLLSSDPYKTLMEGVRYGRYLGLHLAAGVPCHHLAFAQDTIEWQIWIDAGAQPLPRKLVITYVEEPGEPQYSATIRRWRLDGTVPEGLFTFEAPEGAQRVDVKPRGREPKDEPPTAGQAAGGR